MRWPLRWRATRDSKPPIHAPPMKTAGGAVILLLGKWSVLSCAEGGEGKKGISWSSNSMTVGWTPMVARSFFMTWHMQHELRLKMITGCSDISRWIRASADSSSSIDREEDEAAPLLMLVVVVVVVAGPRSR